MKQQTNVKQLLLLTGVGLLFGLLVSEIVLRLLQPPQLAVARQPCIYLPDEQIGYRYAPQAVDKISRNFNIDNVVQINALGFHDIEHDPAESGRYPRVLVVGDSFTAALQVPVEAGWSQIAENELSQNGHTSAEIINLGLDGTGTDVHLALIQQYLPQFQPDIVVVAFYENDITDALSGLKFRECYKGHYVLTYQNVEQRDSLRNAIDLNEPTALARWLFEHIYLARLFFLRTGNIIFQTNYITPSWIDISVEENQNSDQDYVDRLFENLIALEQEQAFQLLIIPVPTKSDAGESLTRLEQTLSQSTREQLTILNLVPVMTELQTTNDLVYEQLFWEFDGHFNETGNRIFGLAVARAIQEYVE